MIELVVLIVIVIVIVLCIVSAMYKCTDGTMDTKDFSVSTCSKLGDGTTVKESDTTSTTSVDDTVTSSPLLSGGGVTAMLFGSALSGEDDDTDYSGYMDYFRLSKDGVRVDEYTEDLDEDGEPDYFDSLEVDAFGPGECAKICYDKDSDINGQECNAFKMNSNGRKCSLYWSQSKSGVTEDETVFRLKVPRTPSTHAQMNLIDIKASNTSKVFMFEKPDYFSPGLTTDAGNTTFMDGMDEGFYKTGYSSTSTIKSMYIPPDRCVKTFTGSNGAGTATEYTMSQPDLSDKTINSFIVGGVDSMGRCEFPTGINVEYSYYLLKESGKPSVFYRNAGTQWGSYGGGEGLTIQTTDPDYEQINVPYHSPEACWGLDPVSDIVCQRKLDKDTCLSTKGNDNTDMCMWNRILEEGEVVQNSLICKGKYSSYDDECGEMRNQTTCESVTAGYDNNQKCVWKT